MEKEHGRAILAALNKVFNDIKSEELQIPESIAEESDEMLTEWDDIRDASELFSLLHESEFEDVDVFMVEVDQSGNKTLRSVHFGVVVEELINCKCGGIVRNEIW